MNENLSEKDLLAECRNGSREAFEMFFYQNQKRVFSVALNFFGGDSLIAEDITQQVFLKIFTHLENFRGEAAVTTWLYRLTTNACIDEQRKKKRFSFFADLFGVKEPKTKRTPDEKFESREISVEIQKALATIDAKFRLPILLKYVEGLSYREIAEVLDCSEGTIASRLNRGNKLLARKLEHLKGEVLR
ncbi:MAG: RNA polymerase sigma factor [Pyrinomonadaceae bacterium]